jgi:O-antigen ligase
MDITGGNLEKLLNRRFYRIGEKLYYFGSDAGGDNYVDTRLGTIRESINTFLQYPLFGVGYKCGNVFSSLESFGVGTHSEAFDMLAQHGLVGASLFFAFLFSGLKKIYHTTQCKICIYPLMIMLIFNPFRYYHGYFAVFTLIPMISMYYGMLRPKEKRGQEDER